MSFKNFFNLMLISDISEAALQRLSEEEDILLEGTTASRYSIEVNFRSEKKEVLESFAKIALGYVSAAIKQNGFHVKQVFQEPPMRILVSSRNWDDGEWVGVVTFNPNKEGGSFIISKGFYNKDSKNISVQSSEKCSGDSAADVTKDLRNVMHSFKGKKDRQSNKLRPVPLRRGPKQ